MNPPQELRTACERVMVAARTNQSPSVLLDSLKRLGDDVLEGFPGRIEAYVEYILIPLFLVLPSDAEKAQQVSERVREECLRCIRLVVTRCSALFERRADLFFPALLRALASLTDVQQEGRLISGLKEETKTEAVRLLDAVIQTQASIERVDNPVVFHCVAMLLDISAKERSKDLRADALRALLSLLNRASPLQVEFMFPGATSSLCETSRADFKAGPLVPQLAVDALRECVTKVLSDDRFEENSDADSSTSLADVLKKARSIQQKTKGQREAQPTLKDNSGEEDENDKSTYFARLFPLMARLLQEDVANEVPTMVRIARVRLAADTLGKCRIAVAKAGPQSSLALLRKVVLGCADVDETVQIESRQTFEELKKAFTGADAINLSEMTERILLDSLLSLSERSDVNGDRDDDAIVETRLGLCAFLLKSLGPKRARTALDASQRKIMWSLLLFLQCESSRFATQGKLEFARVSSRFTSLRLGELLQAMVDVCPEAAQALSSSLMDSVESALISTSTSQRVRTFDQLDQETSDQEEVDEETAMQIPRSCLPQAIHLADALCTSDTFRDALLARITQLDQLWSLRTLAVTNRLTPQDAMLNALIRTAGLECIASHATKEGPKFKLKLVDTLFPVLQSLGDENPGVRLAAESCLSTITSASGYTSDAVLLQTNVDYIVDSIIRRLPQLSLTDLRFAEVIEALIKRIPVWMPGEETSPWVQDLVHTVLTGLDDRVNSAQVVWSLLRIAEVVATRATDIAKAEIPHVAENDTDVITVQSSAMNEKKMIHHDQVVDEAIAELTRWVRPLREDNGPKPETDDRDGKDGVEEDGNSSGVTMTNEMSQVLQAAESILIKSAMFIADDDVLVRQQAARVATKCIALLGNESPDKARTAVHQIWPFIVEQLKEEKHPAIMGLLLDSLTVAASTTIGADFFTRRFSDEAWPVLERVLERAAPPSVGGKRSRTPLFRDLELAKKVLKCLSSLDTMLIPRAEKIAIVTSRFITRSINDGESKELKRLACDIWFVLAQRAGDVVWLAVAVAASKVSPQRLGTRRRQMQLDDPVLATALWNLLEAQ